MRLAFASIIATVLALAACSEATPTRPTPTPMAVPVSTEPFQLRLSDASGRIFQPNVSAPKARLYSSCFTLDHVTTALTISMEIAVLGVDREVLATGTLTRDLFPGSGRIGCGDPSAWDFDMTHPVGERYRLTVSYGTSEGKQRTVEREAAVSWNGPPR